MPPLSEMERWALIELLDQCVELLGSRICNDFTIPNTPEGREFFRKLDEYARKDDPNHPINEPKETGRLIHYDFIVMHYLLDKLNLKK